MAALPDSLDRVRREALDALQSRLNALCDEADDKFFDLSQNAPADEQSTYFEAMRELRVQRPAIVEGVRSGVDHEFAALGSPVVENKGGGSLDATLDGLSLLDDEQLDVSVAFQGMVARARDVVANDIDHLRQRIDKVLAREIEVERVPLHPARVCEHFRAAIDRVSIPLKARLILYKFFERTVLETLRDIIAQANLTLVQAGVLPEIKSAKPRPMPSTDRRSRDKPQKAARAHDDEDEGEGGGGAGGAALSELLALARQALGVRSGGGGGFGGGMPGMPGMPMQTITLNELPAGQMPVMQGGQLMAGGMIVQSDVPVHVIAPAELTNLLTRLQQMQPAMPAPAEGGRLLEHAELVDVKGGLSELMKDATADEQPRALNGADDDVIGVVSMLFDFILDDKELPSEMKALIGRLQIPMLKVALLDRELFAEQDHPARLLVNALARAGIGWTRESDDGLFARMSDVVYAVLNEFTDDVSLFERLWKDFSAFATEREKRMSMIETRLRDREEGQAKSEEAQQKVRETVTKMLSGRRLPGEVLAFIQDGWQQVLYMTALREGTASDTWQQRVKALEVLVWCAQKHEKPDAVEKQRALVPRLAVSLRKGLDAAGGDAAGSLTLLDSVQKVLQHLLEGEAQRTVKIVAEAPPAPAADAKPAEAKAAARPAEAVQVLRRTEEEVVIAAPPPPPPPPAAPPAENRWLQLVDGLAPGTWIEFVDDDFKVRAKIAARIRSQDRFVFVNGRGVKTIEKSSGQLAADFESGMARMVNDTALFDRALEGMISRLKAGQVAG